MCAIWGFSLAEGSKVKSRELAHALATEGESRGTDAAGWAYATRGGGYGMFKEAVAGSQLSFKGMPRRADTVIGHNRFATQGHQSDNSNNHPQVSPDGVITLVHNGHIDNDVELRAVLTDGHTLATVDTSVIPAVLAEYGTEGTGLIAGYAAAAWLDTRTSNTIHLSRLDTSPVAIARLLDGSIVFASTERILARALQRVGLSWIGSYPATFLEMSDGDYMTITDAEVEWKENLEWYIDYSRKYYSGGSGWGSVASSASQGEIAQKAIAPTASQRVFYEPDGRGISYARAILTDAFGVEGYFNGHGTWVSLADGGTTSTKSETSFYILDHDGDWQAFDTLNHLITFLVWNSGPGSEGDLTTDLDIGWVNKIIDIGHVEDNTDISWVQNPAEIEQFDAVVTGGLSFVLSGVDILGRVMVRG